MIDRTHRPAFLESSLARRSMSARASQSLSSAPFRLRRSGILPVQVLSMRLYEHNSSKSGFHRAAFHGRSWRRCQRGESFYAFSAKNSPAKAEGRNAKRPGALATGRTFPRCRIDNYAQSKVPSISIFRARVIRGDESRVHIRCKAPHHRRVGHHHHAAHDRRWAAHPW